ncbi:taurine dioxygenase [Candidatus Entotheonella serta]|nr:taurine dioxygenase [Candidatus Entotheonella serta]
MRMNVVESSKVIGAEVFGLNLGELLDAAAFGELERHFYDRSVLCVRDQTLSPEALVNFARRFGEVDRHFLSHYTHPEHPNILIISNIKKENGRDIGYADAGRVWHSDGSYLQRPVGVSMLYAIKVPEENGEVLGRTQFASAWAAYDGLSDAVKAQIEGLEAIHQVAGRRKAIGTGQAQDRAIHEQQPEAIHPLVRTHPYTGRKYLFVTKGECHRVRGMEEAESLALIEALADEIPRPAYRYVHNWRVGDVLIWDNRAVQHLASFDYQWPKHRRLMHRVTVSEPLP